MKKRIKKTDLKYAEQSDHLDWLVEDINKGGDDLQSALWILNPMCGIASEEKKEAMNQLLYSLAKNLNSNDAWFVFTQIANKLGTCQAFVERWLRGIDKITIHTNFGQNYIEVK